MLSTQLPAGMLCALALLFFLSLARAGEPIQFSNDKAAPAPNDPTQQVDRDMFKTWKSKRPVTSPLNSITPFITPGPVDPKDERRTKSIRDERKNWMLLEPGELQKRDQEKDNEFGGRGVSIDDTDDRKDSSYIFYNVTSQKSEKANRPQNAPVEDDQPKKENRSLSIFGPRDADKPGAHTASELNLKNLIDPAQVNATRINNNEASLFQFLKENSAPPPDRDQQARRDNFRDFINGPQGSSTPSGISDPINFRTDLTQERMNPIAPTRGGLDTLPAASGKAPDGFSTPPLGAAFTPGKAGGLPEMISIVPRQPMTGPSLPSPFLTPNDPTKPPHVSVMGSGSLFNRDAPRRGGL